MNTTVTTISKKLIQGLDDITQFEQHHTEIRNCQRIEYQIFLGSDKLAISFDKFSSQCEIFLLKAKQNICQKLENVTIQLNDKIRENVQNVILVLSPYNYVSGSKTLHNDGNYGRFQIYEGDDVIFAYNDLNGKGDIGIGNCQSSFKDWTHVGNAPSIETKILKVFGVSKTFKEINKQ